MYAISTPPFLLTTSHPVHATDTDTAKITYKTQNRTTIDKDKLKDIFGEDLKLFEKVTSYKVLRVK